MSFREEVPRRPSPQDSLLSVSLDWDVQLTLTRFSNGHFLLHALDFFCLGAWGLPPSGLGSAPHALLGTRRLPVYLYVPLGLPVGLGGGPSRLRTLVVDRLGGWNKRVVSF